MKIRICIIKNFSNVTQLKVNLCPIYLFNDQGKRKLK